MTKEFKELTIQDNFMFQAVMRNPRHCKMFLEIILNIKIEQIEYVNYEETIDLTSDGRGVRLDVYVADGKGTIYNIEMQTTKNKNLPKRSRYYQGMIDLNILEKGGDYQTLKKSLVIFICTYDPFDKGHCIYTFSNRCREVQGLELDDAAIKVFLNTKGIQGNTGKELQNLLSYIDGEEPKDIFTSELADEVQSIRENKKWRREYMTLLMRDNEMRAEGREEANIETAKKLLLLGNMTVSMIANVTALSQEKIEEIKKNLMESKV